MRRLFLYGTLMRGEESHHRLAGAPGARFLGPARTAPRYRLVHLGEYPAMEAGGETAVVGELWEVDPALLAELDEFEGHPDYYRRDRVELADGAVAEGYLLDGAEGREIVSGDWRRWRGVAPSVTRRTR